MSETNNSNTATCSAYVLLSVRVDNLFTREQLADRGIDECDMVLECFDNLHELVVNGDDLKVEDVDTRWTSTSDQGRTASTASDGSTQ